MNLPTKAMKKLVFVMISALAFSACTEDITRNDPSFQGMKDNVLWRASGATYEIQDDGGVIIEGSRQFETLMIRLAAPDEGTYVLGQNQNSMATFTYDNGMESYTYTTGTGNPDAGEVVVTDYYEIGKVITGRYRFNALVVDDNPLVAPVLNFQNGVFYKVPIR